ncbi:MAG TPA: HEAT repeat domain-containing protein [Allosphingosinicella sp.]|nr:HEAT repeat domain-containing protein [Allosphingosinicella sp.]
MLIGLWLVSLAISGAALAIMIGLILLRQLGSWRQKNREAERRRLIPLLLGDTQPAEIETAIWRADDLLVELTVELIQLVRGSDRERFVERAVELGVPQRLRHHLGSGVPRLRQMAAEALAPFHDAASTDSLLAALGDSNPDVRLTAALSLAQSGRSPPVAELVDRLKIGTDERSLLTISLFKDLAEQCPEQLEALLGDAGSPSGARMAAAQALAHAGRYPAVPRIAGMILREEASPDDVPRLLRALGVLAHPAAEDAVRFALGSNSPRIRAAAAEAAGRIGLTQLTGKLVEALSDQVHAVRFHAGGALASFGGAGREVLASVAAKDAGGPASEAAARILAEQGA